MPEIRLSTGVLHYRETGQGVPLLLLSANPGESRDFAAVMPTLGLHYRVLALDWPGYGQSEMPVDAADWTVLRLAAVLREFVDALDLPPALLIGNSVGGNAAARLAAEVPGTVRGLVLVAPGGFTPHNLVTRAFCRLMGSRFALSPRRWASLYLRQRTDTTGEMLARAAGPQSAPAVRAFNRALWRSFGSDDNDLRALAAGISAPVLLLFGEQDPAIPAGRDGRVAARCLPQARFVAMPCGHAPFAEQPARFLAEVLPFLASVTATAGG